MFLEDFNESVVPLVRRMINLEELDLNIKVQCYEKFISGDILKKDIMIHMPQLYKFTLHRYTTTIYVLTHTDKTNRQHLSRGLALLSPYPQLGLDTLETSKFSLAS